ncbi:MAG: aconitate hydratase [Chloroflexi bacterium]|nr:aconitate hydratase [Chloroflexota bacterium]
MAENLTRRLIAAHLVAGEMAPGQEIALAMDQALTQDATGTMAFLQFEQLGFPRIKTKLAISYTDHNMLQTGFENADDHIFLRSASAKYGCLYSRPGNGICHQVHLERFAAPGLTLLGSDSHTCMAGAVGSFASGAGGLEVAATMGGEPYYFPMPRVTLVHLKGKLGPWVASKDIMLELLRRIGVKGGVGRVLEFGGPGVATLTVPQRGTICNLGMETGATATIFPSDRQTRAWLRAQGREEVWRPLAADRGAHYDDVIEIDLASLEPLIACPHSPDNVRPVREVEGTPVAQVAVGSSNNSSYADLMTVARMLEGQRVPPEMSLCVSPGSRQVLEMVTRSGGLMALVAAGARILEAACGPCIGMGQAPPSGAASVRTFNRNFPGRSGTPDDQVYLASPEVAAATALRGAIADPRRRGTPPRILSPRRYLIDDSMIVAPPPDGSKVELVRGPNIKPVPQTPPLTERVTGQALLKLGDNISTDQIMPAGNKHLPLRSNIPALAQYVFEYVDHTFAARAQAAGSGFIVARENYGQGSSREHAALCPMYLGVRGVFARSFARIHQANLVNFGLLPLVLTDQSQYDSIDQGDELELLEVRAGLKRGSIKVRNLTKKREFVASCHSLSARQVDILLAGGLMNYIKARRH